MTTQATPAISDERLAEIVKLALETPSVLFVPLRETLDMATELRQRRASTPAALDRLRSVDGLEELRKLSERATGGEWYHYNEVFRKQFGKSRVTEIQSPTGKAIVAWSGFDGLPTSTAKKKNANAALMVAAVNFVRNFLSITPQASATAQEPERRTSEDKGGEAVVAWQYRYEPDLQWHTVEFIDQMPKGDWPRLEKRPLFATPRSPDEAQEAVKVNLFCEVCESNDDCREYGCAAFVRTTTPPVDPAGVTAMRDEKS